MKIERNEIDSQAFGFPVFAISDYDPAAALPTFEHAYVSVKLPVEELASIHALEDAGFRLVECQIRSELALRKPYPVQAFPYDFVKVETEDDLAEVLAIATRTFVHDRFSTDPEVAPGVSARRYQAYVRQSFHAPNEAVYRLIDRETGKTVAFKTHRYQSPTEALLLLGGVDPECKGAGLGAINAYFECNQLITLGVKKLTTHISASNYPIFVLEISKLGFRVTQSYAVLRKIYVG